MGKKYFDYHKNRLIFEEQRATADFWDNLWDDNNLKKTIEKGKSDWFVSRITKKFIPPNKSRKILEGGCGKGAYVYSLHFSGYDAYGVDFAPRIVKKINHLFPELKITAGNVEKLDFPDTYFDGYWSLGVIEHFYEGYQKVFLEMERVLKKGGYLFITFPCLCPLRKIKKMLRKYEKFEKDTFCRDTFYQFALDYREVKNEAQKHGFTLVYKKRLDGLKGLKDETFLKPVLQRLYDSKSFWGKASRITLSEIFSPLSHHSLLLVFKKND